MPFNSFSKDLDEGSECIFSKSLGSTGPGWIVNILGIGQVGKEKIKMGQCNSIKFNANTRSCPRDITSHVARAGALQKTWVTQRTTSSTSSELHPCSKGGYPQIMLYEPQQSWQSGENWFSPFTQLLSESTGRAGFTLGPLMIFEVFSNLDDSIILWF